MNHQQILGNLSSRIVDPIVYDVSRLTSWEMLGSNRSDHEKISSRVVSQILLRWNCVLQAPGDEVAKNYKDQTSLALAVVLHKYGFHVPSLIKRAIKAIDILNKEVALSDNFFRKSVAIKEFIVDLPRPLNRRPSTQKDITFWRAGEVASIKIGKLFYAVYVHEIFGSHEAPIVELYDFASPLMPTAADLLHSRAKGGPYNDGVDRIERFAVYGMRDIPDMANQFHLVASNVPPPSNDHLGEAVGSYVVSDVFRLIGSIKRSFGK